MTERCQVTVNAGTGTSEYVAAIAMAAVLVVAIVFALGQAHVEAIARSAICSV